MMIDALENALPRVLTAGDPTRVATTTLLPSGAMTSVVVRPSPNGTFFVSDDAAGRNDLLAIGITDVTRNDRKRGHDIARRLGLLFEEDAFIVREVTADQLAGAIVYVAEATRAWASAAAENAAKRVETALARRVEERIRRAIPNVKIAREADLAGASTKKHRFDLVLELGDDRKAVFEVVTPNAISLSAAHLKLFDLKEAHPEWLREAVTERIEDWTPADMSLLSAVTTHVRPMDRDWGDLPALVH